jgi:quinoprotein glucose dehydrogenase
MITVSLAGLNLGSAAALAAPKMPDGDWWQINRDAEATRYSPLRDIDKSNVSKLALAWSYTLRGVNTAVPLVVGGTMYISAGNRVIALDADTGKEIWVYTLTREAGMATNPTVSTRGVSYWPGDAKTAARILFMSGSRMLALDAAAGKPVDTFGKGGAIDIGIPYGGTPTIGNDIAVVGAATLENPIGVPGNTRAFDVRTGKKLWEFQSVPAAGQDGHETWLNDGWWGRSGTNMWSFAASIDAARNVVYVPLGTPAPNYYGGDRPGDNLFGNSMVALDLKTGKRIWHFQTVHHDLWDIDQPSPGPLLNLTVNGKTHPSIVFINKDSLFYIFDRVTGKSLFPIEERPVPKGDVPGEWYSPTQPFPTQTPPLSRVSMTKADIVTAEDTTPEHAAACQAMWDKAGGYMNQGPFTPFMYRKDGDPPRSTIQLPGGIGGVDWGGEAVDPTNGMVFVNVNDTSLVGWTEKVTPGISYSFEADKTDQPYNRASVDGKGPFFTYSAPISGKYDDKGRGVGATAPCYKGPWSQLIAIDANTGRIRWKVPLGLIDALPPGKQLAGNAGSAGPTATAGGLVFIGASNDKRFRAYDAASGKILWEAQLSNNANANPMSYRGRSGKQYVAINAGGTLMTYALP